MNASDINICFKCGCERPVTLFTQLVYDPFEYHKCLSCGKTHLLCDKCRMELEMAFGQEFIRREDYGPTIKVCPSKEGLTAYTLEK